MSDYQGAVLTLQDSQNQVLDRDYRSWLKNTAKYHELPSFERALLHVDRFLEDSDTHDWIFAASHQVIDVSSPTQKQHLLGQCSCDNQSELVIRSAVEGVFSLIFAEWAGKDKCNWKFHFHLLSGPNIFSDVPESMHMDANRLYLLRFVAYISDGYR